MGGRGIKFSEKLSIFLYLLIFLTILFFIISISSILKATKDLEKIELAYSKKRLKEYFDNQKEVLRHQVLELGVWSELFWQIKNGRLNERWFKENLDNWLPVVKLDFSYIFDKEGNLFYQTHPLLFDCEKIIPEIKKRKNLSFFLKLNKDIILNVAASLINRSEDALQEGEYAGFIFIGKILDKKKLKEVKIEIKEDFEIVNFDENKEKLVFLTDYQDKPVAVLKILPSSEERIYKKLTKYISPVWFLIIGSLYALIYLSTKEVKRKIKEEKEKQLVFLGKIIGFIVHELRNPLATIKNCFYLLKEIKDENKKKTYLEMMEKGVEQIAQTVDTFLKISKGEEGEKEMIDVKDLISEIITEINIPSYIKIENSLNNIKVLGNKTQLKYIFKNIIKNSIESIKEKGLIKISYKEENNRLKLIFSDNGCGIKKRELKKIFEPFYTTKEKGMGFGLSLVKYLLELNKGEIKIFSQEGKGTDVLITLLKG
ncbi:MAG: ATP-binding protein [candidate division WOR-3 bacterium]|nr:ATP-binding protein [candidate division WOR-3 bacterium]MDW8113937.1 ATP-binding protein [candidate division WOR-3 bacterium]